jgi:ubiquinol-cytochrome c reductase cytochrome c subunit
MKRLLLAAALAMALLVGGAQAAPPNGPPIVPTLNEAGKSQLQLGEELFAANCVMCHGIGGRGKTKGNMSLLAPPLIGVGEQSADFYLRTGYMPLGDALDQPIRSRVRFSEPELRGLIAYVGSLGSGPPVPHPDTRGSSLEEGRELFTEHCSGCHQVVAEGGIMPGAKAPPLNRATPVQIAEAVRIGPYTMPNFTEKAIDEEQLNAIIAYVQYAQDPQDEGGWGINHLGPFPEGMVTWLIAIVVLIATCVVIGKRRSES